ncbi:unknown [Bacteroides sp. CAG:709]|nr:unknown [Bacteroides sp. CAG:709]
MLNLFSRIIVNADQMLGAITRITTTVIHVFVLFAFTLSGISISWKCKYLTIKYVARMMKMQFMKNRYNAPRNMNRLPDATP